MYGRPAPDSKPPGASDGDTNMPRDDWARTKARKAAAQERARRAQETETCGFSTTADDQNPPPLPKSDPSLHKSRLRSSTTPSVAGAAVGADRRSAASDNASCRDRAAPPPRAKPREWRSEWVGLFGATCEIFPPLAARAGRIGWLEAGRASAVPEPGGLRRLVRIAKSAGMVKPSDLVTMFSRLEAAGHVTSMLDMLRARLRTDLPAPSRVDLLGMLIAVDSRLSVAQMESAGFPSKLCMRIAETISLRRKTPPAPRANTEGPSIPDRADRRPR